MPNAAYNRLVKLLNLEAKRTRLAQSNDLVTLRKTYNSGVIKVNGNTGQFWDQTFQQQHQEKNLHQPNYVERDRNLNAYSWLKRLVVPGMSVLNIGCGDAKFESLFKLGDFPHVNYEGMDFAQSSVTKLKKRFPNLNFWIGDIIQVKLPKKYDVVCMFEVLEHILDHQALAVLTKIKRALKPGGYLMIAVPLNEPLLEMFPANPNEHVRAYSRELILAELEMAGFKIQKVQEFVAFSSSYWLKKILSKTLLKKKWQPNDILILAKKI